MDVWVIGWGSGQIIKNQINLDLIRIIQLFEDLHYVETTPAMGGWVGGLLDGWLGRLNQHHLYFLMFRHWMGSG